VSQVRKIVRLILEVLREVFDESAYRRFLEHNKVASSPGAYAAFCRDRDSASARRARCC
jgi:hypothetical protein